MSASTYVTSLNRLSAQVARAPSSSRMAQLNRTIQQASGWMGRNVQSPGYRQVLGAVRQAANILQQARVDTAQAPVRRAPSGKGGGSRTASYARSGGGGRGSKGAGSRQPARRRRSTSRRAPAERSEESGSGAEVGGELSLGFSEPATNVFSALMRTFSPTEWPVGGLLALWNPNVSFFRRPVVQLFMITTGLAVVTAGGLYLLTESKKKDEKKEAA